MTALLSLASGLWSWRWLVVGLAFAALLLWLDITRDNLARSEADLSATRGQVASLLVERDLLRNRHAVEMAAVKNSVNLERSRRAALDREKGKTTDDKGPVSDAVRSALDSVRVLRAGNEND